MRQLTPREIVAELDKYIVGQNAAKRAVAIAIRNRYRRQKLSPELQDDIYPKNILMIGPTGVGKTEIARRLAKLVNAPFIKVEATKFTEVGYVGRDVESMVRELVETALRTMRSDRMMEVAPEAGQLARDRLLDILAPLPSASRRTNPLEAFLGAMGRGPETEDDTSGRIEQQKTVRRDIAARLDAGELEDDTIEIEIEDSSQPMLDMFAGTGAEELGLNFQDVLSGILPRKRNKRRVTVAEARELLTAEEAARLVDKDRCGQDAVRHAEQSGIIFIDEIDKIAGRERAGGPDVSREGVQRDILPIVEGSTVLTKHGPVRTDHILFIAAGAFHMSKPSDLIPELQGRFPIRVELTALEQDDFRRILTEPENSLTKQYTDLLQTECVTLEFSPCAIDRLAELAVRANEQSENIGARRLHTLLERVLDELSFEAPELGATKVTITEDYVSQRLADVIADSDLARYIL